MESPRGDDRQCENLKVTTNRGTESIQEGSSFMKTSSAWNFRSIVGKMMMGLVLTAMVGSIDVAPAFGKDNRGKQGKRYEQRGRGHDRGHYVYERGRRVYRPYVYRERVYLPPPVVYVPPPPPPGISIFFPPFIFHPWGD
jgi:hypothetical protein